MKRQRQEELMNQEQPEQEVVMGSSKKEEETVDPVVTDRMLNRVFIFAGLPVAVGLLLFPMFWYLKVCPLKPQK